ncbi:MAG: hypothetical protein LBU32_26160 [Clostridiales bacterium]|jgi:secreted protein with Ig-like and vWFA domain|nr:hypothetical protein [Clostridiales bacterium]
MSVRNNDRSCAKEQASDVKTPISVETDGINNVAHHLRSDPPSSQFSALKDAVGQNDGVEEHTIGSESERGDDVSKRLQFKSEGKHALPHAELEKSLESCIDSLKNAESEKEDAFANHPLQKP